MPKNHKTYDKYKGIWKKIDNLCEAEDLGQYIPELSPSDTSEANKLRNNSYKERAVYTNFIGYTERGLLGLAFRRYPTCNIPSLLDYTKVNIDGLGNSIYQQSQQVTKSVIRKGRAGLFVNFPAETTGVSMQDVADGKIFSTVKYYPPESITNWELTAVGSQVKLSKVVLEEVEELDGKDIRVKYELLLIDSVFYVEKYEEGDSGSYELAWSREILKGDGTPFNEITFKFVGSETNAADIDTPPLKDFCPLQIGHYRNSAEYEDVLFLAGQPQPWMSGIDDNWLETREKALASAAAQTGVGVILPVPSGEKFDFAQITPHVVSKEGMADKLQDALGLGAMFIQAGSAVKTATQVAGEQAVSHSVLSLICSNVSEAYYACLSWVYEYMSISPLTDNEVIEFELNQEFINKDINPGVVNVLLQALKDGKLPASDFYHFLQKYSVIDAEKSLEDIEGELLHTTIKHPGGE